MRRSPLLLACLGFCGVAVLHACSVSSNFPPYQLVPAGFVDPLPMPTSPYGEGMHGELVVTEHAQITKCFPATGEGKRLTLASVTESEGLDLGLRGVVMQVRDDPAIEQEQLQYGNVGKWEIVRVVQKVQVDNDTIVVTLGDEMSNIYSSAGGNRAQLCTMHEYTNVRVIADASLHADPWDGNSGGVIAFFANGSVVLDTRSSISASGSGFRGGYCAVVYTAGTAHIDEDNPLMPAGIAGGKAEGLINSSATAFGRGQAFNAGGGGNYRNGGGGGGGNAGAGGGGGRGSDLFDVPNVAKSAGRPGYPLLLNSLAPPRLLFGGGGGAGQRSDEETPIGPLCGGGAGGGIVFVFAPTITGSGTIEANGARGVDTVAWGSGGGGAGGTVYLQADTVELSVDKALRARGGNGGDVKWSGSTHYGPGGGGGGGRIYAAGTHDPSTYNVDGAVNGAHVSSTGGAIVDPNWGAQVGVAGNIDNPISL